MSDWYSCDHYYADRSGMCCWPVCVKCGQPQPASKAPSPTLECCGNTEAQGHTGACVSLDAVAKRKQAHDEGRILLDRVYTDDELRNSPYTELMAQAFAHRLDCRDCAG